MRLSVIIPHAGSPTLKACLRSVVESVVFSKIPSEILVVDDRVRDVSPPPLTTSDLVRMITLQTSGREGFAAAVNTGARAATGELLLILNDDVTLDLSCVSALCQATVKRPLAAAFQARVRSAKDLTRFDYAGAAGGLIDRYGYPYCLGRVLFSTDVDRGQFDTDQRIFWTSGCAMLVRSEDYRATGGLYEGFGMHMEEIDLCWRLWRSGRECWSAPLAIVFHEGGATLARGSFRKAWWNHRNHWMLIFRNLPARRLQGAVAIRLTLDSAELLWSLSTLKWRNAAAVLCAMPWPLFNICRLRHARRDAQGPYELPATAPVYPRSIVMDAIRDRVHGVAP